MQKFRKRDLFRSMLALGCTTLLATSTVVHSHDGDGNDDDDVRAVFVGTNHNNTQDANEPANQVVMYRRGADGALSLVGRFNTGGQGSGPSLRFAGDGLGSSHSLQLTQDKRFLLVTNAGSNNITVFRVTRHGLRRTDLVSSQGGFPNSITQHGRLVYVLNSAGDGNIAGFELSQHGTLTPIPGSVRPLDADQHPATPDTLFNPAQVSFTPNGRQLVVTIKDGPAPGLTPDNPTGPGRILVFHMEGKRPSAQFTRTDLPNNPGPFGFSFDRRGNMLVALFVGGPNLTAAAGSFRINEDDTVTAITSPVFDGQLDTCWLENNGRYAYGANYTSGNISSFRIRHDGSLELLQAVAGVTNDLPGPPANASERSQGSTPLDLAVSGDGRFLYNVLPGSGAVAGWRIRSDGSLTKIGEFSGLPQAVEGDHAPEERFGPGGSPAGIVAN